MISFRIWRVTQKDIWLRYSHAGGVRDPGPRAWCLICPWKSKWIICPCCFISDYLKLFVWHQLIQLNNLIVRKEGYNLSLRQSSSLNSSNKFGTKINGRLEARGNVILTAAGLPVASRHYGKESPYRQRGRWLRGEKQKQVPREGREGTTREVS